MIEMRWVKLGEETQSYGNALETRTYAQAVFYRLEYRYQTEFGWSDWVAVPYVEPNQT